MRLPGFTAENSVSRKPALWRAEISAARDGDTGIVPQLCRQYGNTINCTDCFSFEGNDYCWTHTIHLGVLF
jgi:hypothetical protein